MNSLSWILYLADVVSSLKVLLTILLSGGMVSSIIIVICYFIFMADISSYDVPCKDRPDGSSDYIKFNSFRRIVFSKLWWGSLLFAAFLQVAAPGKETIYMIAASEAGGMVIENPEFKETMGLIKKKIDGYLKDAPQS